MSEEPGHAHDAPVASTAPLSAAQRRAATTLLSSKVLSQLADLLANPKTTLTWLMQAVGAPPVLTSMLVPIRESGSMLPQLWLSSVVRRSKTRKWAAAGAVFGQALAALVIALAAVFVDTLAAGVIIVGSVLVSSLVRAVSSIAGKDVLARTVPKGARGRIGGLSLSIAGAVGAAGSIATMAVAASRTAVPPSTYAAVIAIAGVCFGLAAAGYAAIHEPPQPPSDRARPSTRLSVLGRDPQLRRFVSARSALLGSALGGPYVVLLGHGRAETLSTLASFVLAGAAASASSAWAWGRLADRSSRRTMAYGGALASVAGALAVGLSLASPHAPAGLWPGLYFVFSIGYAGVRVGRKTYVVDIATGERRTVYVAASNTAISAVVLVLGAVAAALHHHSATAALTLLVISTAVGAWLSLRLPEPDAHSML